LGAVRHTAAAEGRRSFFRPAAVNRVN
jgi:hypothetical protein